MSSPTRSVTKRPRRVRAGATPKLVRRLMRNKAVRRKTRRASRVRRRKAHSKRAADSRPSLRNKAALRRKPARRSNQAPSKNQADQRKAAKRPTIPKAGSRTRARTAAEVRVPAPRGRDRVSRERAGQEKREVTARRRLPATKAGKSAKALANRQAAIMGAASTTGREADRGKLLRTPPSRRTSTMQGRRPISSSKSWKTN